MTVWRTIVNVPGVSMARKGDGPVRRSLAIRDYRLILIAHAVSKIGNWFYNVGLIVYLFD